MKKKRKIDDLDEDETVEKTKHNYFHDHFEKDFDNIEISARTETNKISLDFPQLGNVSVFGPNRKNADPEIVPFDDVDVKNILRKNLPLIQNALTPLQADVFAIINKYLDFYFPYQCQKNLHELRIVQVLHALNHVLKSRSVVLSNNAALKSSKKRAKRSTNETVENQRSEQKILDDTDDSAKFRDQGFTRPRVLILTPFRSGALKIVEIICVLLFGENEKAMVKNRQRFYDEYSSAPEEEKMTDKPRFHRPDDFKELFAGNTDDCFRIGLSVSKKSLKLYADFFTSDIILASPLGVRSATGTTDEKDFDVDFLSSIEILILDQCDVFLMQNWSHLIHIMENLNTQPKKSHDADFTRIRYWALNDKSKFYRQTILFSSINTAEMKSILSKFCWNFDGAAFSDDRNGQKMKSNALCEISVDLPQAFYRYDSNNLETDADRRFEFFTRKILAEFKNSSMRHTLIYVASYFDFVRLRNFMKKDDCSFVQVCEYADERKVNRARDLFYHEKKQFMLFTERFHFYKRYKIRGVRHLIFYQLPVYPAFYAEICNMLEDQASEGVQLTCTVVYSPYDALRLAAVIGVDKANNLLSSDKNVHMIVAKS